LGGRLDGHCVPLHSSRLDVSVLQLETAKEILGEVFGTTSSEVDEMIKHRMIER
jgi:hypothetical protein